MPNLITVILLFFFSGLFCALAAEEVDFGPIFTRDTDVCGNQRCRALGPVFESRQDRGGDVMLAVRPFSSYAYEASENIYRHQIIYPVWMAKGKEVEYEWHFCLLCTYHDFDRTDPKAKYRLWLIPLYFQGRSIDGAPYMAIFPLAGSIREFIVFDEFRFALFPLALQTRVNEVKTTAALWPIMSRTTGGGNDRLNVFPLFGYSNLREESKKHYILWPFWTYAHYDRPESPGYSYIIFPFYGRVHLENQTSTMVLPPLFRFAHGTCNDGTNQDLTYCPWPIVQYASGDKNKSYIWPLWGKKNIDTSKRWFFLWPLGAYYEHTAPFYRHTRGMFFPILYATSTRGPFDKPDRKMDQPRKTLKVWPVFSLVNDTDYRRFVLPSLFPFRDYEAIDRNYSPLWTIYTHSSYKDQREDELFWGLIRLRQSKEEERFSLFPLVSVAREKKNGRFTWSFLKGLFSLEKAGEKRKFRVLYFFSF